MAGRDRKKKEEDSSSGLGTVLAAGGAAAGLAALLYGAKKMYDLANEEQSKSMSYNVPSYPPQLPSSTIMAASAEWPQWCTLCDVKLTSKPVSDSHYGGKTHKDTVRKLALKQQELKQAEKTPSKEEWPKICGLCNVPMYCQENFNTHMAGKKHQAAMKEKHESVNTAKKSHSDYPAPINPQSNRMTAASSMTSLDGLDRYFSLPQSRRESDPHIDFEDSRTRGSEPRRPSRGNYRGRNPRGARGGSGNHSTQNKESMENHPSPMPRGRGLHRPFQGRGRGGRGATSSGGQSSEYHMQDETGSSKDLNDISEISQEEMQDIVKKVLKEQNISSATDLPESALADIQRRVRAIVLERLEKAQVKPDEEDNSEDSDGSTASSRASDVQSKNRKRRERPRKSKVEKKPASAGQININKEIGASASSKIIDENAVFCYVVKCHGGQCLLSDVLKGAPHLFPDGFDVLDWFITSHKFMVFRRKNPTLKDQALVVTKINGFKLCPMYLSRSKFVKVNCRDTCREIHICPQHLNDKCRLSSCWFSHSLTDEHNRQVIDDLNMSELFTEKQLFALLRSCTLYVCDEWNSSRTCHWTAQYQLCPRFHICKNFLLGRCLTPADDCKYGHQYDSFANKLILSSAFYGLHNVKPELLPKAVIIENQDSTTDLDTAEIIIPERPTPQEHVPEIPKPKEQVPVKTKPRDPVQVKPKKSLADETWKIEKIHPDDKYRDICEPNLRKNCRNGPDKCHAHHYYLPYLWRIKIDGKWLSLPDSVKLEEAYSRPDRDSYYTFLELNGKALVVTVDMIAMTCSEMNSGDSYEVCRLSTKSYVLASGAHFYHTKWIWYWKDNDGSWVAYEFEELPYQDIVEAKYQHGDIACFFEAKQFRYLLDLKQMQQINVETGTIREVRRRPQMVTEEDMMKGKCEMLEIKRFVDQKILPNQWSPMNTSTFLIPDLIMLDESNGQFQETLHSFFVTMDAAAYKIDRIFRVQNLSLWEKYERKQREMRHSEYLKDDLNELNLFHGTSSEEVVRCICKQGFDWRICGKHGTMYGSGSYFARDAKYSNTYSPANAAGKQYMFRSRVLVGLYVKGTQDMLRPPPKDSNKLDGDHYNSCVDNTVNPSIYVVFHDDQCYPEFLIEYRSTRPRPSLPIAQPGMLAAMSSTPGTVTPTQVSVPDPGVYGSTPVRSQVAPQAPQCEPVQPYIPQSYPVYPPQDIAGRVPLRQATSNQSARRTSSNPNSCRIM